MADAGAADGAAADRDDRARPAARAHGFPVELSRSAGSGPACRSARPSPTSARSSWRKILGANETQEQSLVARLPLRRRERARARRPRRPARAAHLPRLRRGQGRAQGARRRRLAPRSASSCARSSRSRTAAAPSSSASRSSRSATCCASAPDGRGVVSCLELPAVQDKPTLWSTALMWLAAELFEELPEVGDLRQAEARVLLRRGAPALQGRHAGLPRRRRAHRAADPLEGHRRLLRHAVPDRPAAGRAGPARQPDPARAAGLHGRGRGVAAGQRADLSHSPTSTTSRSCSPQLAIGEAAVTILDDRGVPTPVVHTRLVAPEGEHGTGRRRRLGWPRRRRC